MSRRYSPLHEAQLNIQLLRGVGIEAEDHDWFAALMTSMGEEKGLALFRDIVAKNGISVRKVAARVRQAFGWTYAGLVVPGYLAATFAAAPVTGYRPRYTATGSARTRSGRVLREARRVRRRLRCL